MSLVGFPQSYHVPHMPHHVSLSHGGSGGGGMTTVVTGGGGRSAQSPEAVYVTATSAAAYYSSPTRYEDPGGSQSSVLDGSYFPTAWTYAESQADIPTGSAYAEYPTNSDGLLQAMDPNNCGGLSHQVQSSSSYGGELHAVPVVRVVKRRCTANRKERRRTLSINNAFADLRDCIPNVPSDTKLSKIKTLRLATSYIAYLMDILAKDDPNLVPEGGFKAEVNKKIETREEKKKREMANLLGATCGEKRTKGRTGWPQHVWALELKQ